MARYDRDWIASLTSPERAVAARPADLLRRAGAVPDAVVIDYGCGPGFLAIPAAAAVGQGGRVIAVDLEPTMRAEVERRAAAAGLTNVRAIDPGEASALAPGTADLVVAALFLHDLMLDERDAMVGELRRLCAASGRLLVVEWIPPGGLAGPSTPTRFAADDLAALLRRGGFAPDAPEPLGDPYYALLARPGTVEVRPR